LVGHFAAGLILVFAWASPVAMAATPEQLVPSSLAPANGASFVARPGPGTGVPWSMTWSVPPGSPAYVWVSVSTTSDLGTVGATLSDIHQIDYFAMAQSQTNPGYWQGVSNVGPTLWTNTPGTYYWQVQAMYADYGTAPFTDHTLVSPIYSIVIVPPPAPTPPPAPPPSAPAPTSGVFTKAEARADVPRAIAHSTHHTPSNVTDVCTREALDAFFCRVTWTDPQYRWQGRLSLKLDSATNTVTFSFAGTRSARKCLRRHSASACARRTSF
jgi:hypothetical protein